MRRAVQGTDEAKWIKKRSRADCADGQGLKCDKEMSRCPPKKGGREISAKGVRLGQGKSTGTQTTNRKFIRSRRTHC